MTRSVEIPGAAPAGDGGLREALEKLAAQWADQPNDYSSEDTQQQIGDGYTLRNLLAAHPAAPAVPQPVDRDHEPGTRFLVVEIPPAVSDEVADEITEKVFEHAAELDEQYDGPWDLFIYRQHNAPPANVPAASAQPVDREALEDAIRDELLPSLGMEIAGPLAKDAVPAVLAVLAGEQEQVESGE